MQPSVEVVTQNLLAQSPIKLHNVVCYVARNTKLFLYLLRVKFEISDHLSTMVVAANQIKFYGALLSDVLQ